MHTMPTSFRPLALWLLIPLALLSAGFGAPTVRSAPKAPAGAWRIEIAGPAYAQGGSIAVDHQNNPHLAYCGQNDLRYASRGASGWTNVVVEGASCLGTALTFGSNNEPHIAYYSSALKYAHYSGGTWHIETVDSGTIADSRLSIALDAANNPHILYAAFPSGALKYAHLTGSAWQTEIVDAGQAVHPSARSSLAVSSTGHPHICYGTYTSDVIKYGYHDGSAWHLETIAVRSGYESCSLALDAQDHIHMSYLNSDVLGVMGLFYGYNDGSGWQRTRVDTDSSASRWAGSSLALNSAGRPRIAYEVPEGMGDRLIFASLDGGAWQKQTVDAPLASGMYDDVDLAVDGNGQPHITYRVHGSNDIMYATQDPLILNHKGYLPVLVRP
jgi:hypothetical protein